MLFVAAIFIAVSAYLVLPSFAEVYMPDPLDPYGAKPNPMPKGYKGCWDFKNVNGCKDVDNACAKQSYTDTTPGPTYGVHHKFECDSACVCKDTPSSPSPGLGGTAPTEDLSSDSSQQMGGMGNMF